MKNEHEEFDQLLAQVIKESEEPKLGEQFTLDMMNRVYEHQHKLQYRWLFILFPVLLLTFGSGLYYVISQDWFFALLHDIEGIFTLNRTMLLLGGAVLYLLYSRILIGVLVLKRQITY